VPLRLPEPAHTREFRAFLERVPEIADSMAVAPVFGEPFSAGKFPVKQGKYREFSRFRARSGPIDAEKCRIYKGFFGKFSARRNREF